jgi:flagellar biosynthesis/type III secretory pathway protein FliH
MGIIKKQRNHKKTTRNSPKDAGVHSPTGPKKGIIKSHFVKMSGEVTVPSAESFFSSEMEAGSQFIDVPYQKDDQALGISSEEGAILQQEPVSVSQPLLPPQKPDAEWQKEVDEAYQRGISETENRLKEDYEGRIKSISTDLLESINGLATEKIRTFEASQTQVLSFAIQIAERIITEEIKASPELLRRIIDEALSKITETDKVIIRAAKEDLGFVNSILPDLKLQLKSVSLVSAQEDRSVTQGGVIIETDLGFIDATVNMKLDILKEAYHDFVKEKESH